MLETLIFRQYRYDNDIENQIKLLEEEIKQDNQNIDKLKKLAEIYHAYKNNDKAIAIYEDICKRNPEDSEMLAYLGYLYYEENNLNEAEKYLNLSLDKHPLEPFVLFLLGNVLSRKGKILEAISFYELAIFFDFDVFTAHIDFGRKYEHMGRHKKALEEYRRALEIDNSDIGLLEKISYLEKKI